jgi:hypothetical protein
MVKLYLHSPIRLHGVMLNLAQEQLYLTFHLEKIHTCGKCVCGYNMCVIEFLLEGLFETLLFPKNYRAIYVRDNHRNSCKCFENCPTFLSDCN